LTRLVGDVQGCSFLDIGCGSGLHSAAALALGASKVRAVDYDPDSVATTRAVLERFAPGLDWTVERADALDLKTLPTETFDIVYSWGVLHHTGDMWKGISNAAALVAPGGRLVLALYLRTPLCGAWKVEKRIYSSQRWLRPAIKGIYVGAYMVAKQIRTGGVRKYISDYKKSRGMNFLTDVDDWLGGYPYESVIPSELHSRMKEAGFRFDTEFNIRSGRGVFGAGCGEWRFMRAR
jgi:2-polyprenyl-6-hydroxyphenyl methylase/3-demethylubiquinone-9 3-methyltransferase